MSSVFVASQSGCFSLFAQTNFFSGKQALYDDEEFCGLSFTFVAKHSDALDFLV
jgi:hypothetical protein